MAKKPHSTLPSVGLNCGQVLQVLLSGWRFKPVVAGILIENNLMKYESQWMLGKEQVQSVSVMPNSNKN